MSTRGAIRLNGGPYIEITHSAYPSSVILAIGEDLMGPAHISRLNDAGADFWTLISDGGLCPYCGKNGSPCMIRMGLTPGSDPDMKYHSHCDPTTDPDPIFEEWVYEISDNKISVFMGVIDFIQEGSSSEQGYVMARSCKVRAWRYRNSFGIYVLAAEIPFWWARSVAQLVKLYGEKAEEILVDLEESIAIVEEVARRIMEASGFKDGGRWDAEYLDLRKMVRLPDVPHRRRSPEVAAADGGTRSNEEVV